MFIEDDGEDFDGFNFGIVFVDEEKNWVFVIYFYCVIKCVYYIMFLISSDDFGLIWINLLNLLD